MSLLTLALIVAATNTQPNPNGTTTKTNSSKTTLRASKNSKTSTANASTDPNAPATTDDAVATDPATPKKPKGKKDEAPAAAPEAGDPASLVANSVDAATQIANAAAKAAMDEVAKLSAIGSGSAGPSLVDGKTVEAGVAGAGAVAKEVSKAGKAKKEAPADSAEAPKPEKKGKPTKTAPTEGKDGELFGVKVEGKPEKK
jgi:hypothetical protein